MSEPDLIELFVRPLNEIPIRYLVSGSIAAMLYGEPRVTHDIDLIVLLRPTDVAQLPQVFPEPEFYLPPMETIVEATNRSDKGQFNIIHGDSGLKADFFIAGRDELYAWAFRNAREYSVSQLSVRLAPPEYVIIRKLEYFREGGSEKHLRDIRAMLAVSGDEIDRTELEEWISSRKLTAEWDRVS